MNDLMLMLFDNRRQRLGHLENGFRTPNEHQEKREDGTEKQC